MARSDTDLIRLHAAMRERALDKLGAAVLDKLAQRLNPEDANGKPSPDDRRDCR